jgi:hypothetical protein
MSPHPDDAQRPAESLSEERPGESEVQAGEDTVPAVTEIDDQPLGPDEADPGAEPQEAEVDLPGIPHPDREPPAAS